MANSTVLLLEGCSKGELEFVAREAKVTATNNVVLSVKHQLLADKLLGECAVGTADDDYLLIFELGIDAIDGFATLSALRQFPSPIRPNVALLRKNEPARLAEHSTGSFERSHETLRQRVEGSGFAWIALDELLAS